MNWNSFVRQIVLFDTVPYILYLVLIGICIAIAIYIRLRWLYGFWFWQPVFHAYDIHYLFYHGIIRHALPEKNKYVNEREIQVTPFSNIQPHQLQQLVHFIRKHFHHRGKNQYIPTVENVAPYFAEHAHPSFVSFYKKDHVLQDADGDLIPEKQIIGVMTTRPLNVSLFTRSTQDTFPVYYADYLCVHRDYRKQNIAPQIIQTHEYIQRRSNRQILVSLFKREGELTGIVPLCVFKTFCFPIRRFRKPVRLPNEMECVAATPSTYRFVHDFMKQVTESRRFHAMISPNIANQLALIQSGNLFVSFLLDKPTQKIQALYVFKRSCMQIDADGTALTCIATVRGDDMTPSLFVLGFKHAFGNIVETHPEYHFGYAVMEKTSDTGIILEDVLKKMTPVLVSPAAYFFYNFAFPTLPSEKTWIVS